MRTSLSIKSVIASMLIVFFGFTSFIITDTAHSKQTTIYGVITKTTGTVKIQLSRKERWQSAEKGMAIGKDTRMITGNTGELEIVFEDGSAIKVERNTRLVIEQANKLAKRRKFRIKLLRGRFTSNSQVTGKISKRRLDYRIASPTAVVSIRGTIVIVEHNGTGKTCTSNICVFEGTVCVKGQCGPEVTVQQNYQTTVKENKPAEKPRSIEERLMKHYNEKVKMFTKRVENYRTNIAQIREQRIKWMKQQKEKYEKKMRQDKQKHEGRFEKLKKKHGFK